MLADFPHQLARSALFFLFLLPANLLFLIRFVRKPQFWVKYCVCAILSVLMTAGIFYYTHGTPANNILSFAFTLLCTVLIARLCFEISWTDSMFCATAGYSAQFIWSIMDEFIKRMFSVDSFLIRLLLAVCVFYVIYQLFGRKIKRGQNLDLNKLLPFSLLTAAALIEIVLCGLMRPFWMVPANRTMMAYSMLLLFVCACSILSLQFSLLSQRTLANELEIVNRMWRREKSQYELTKETIDSINRKCHDMRHQIRTIGHTEHISPETIDEMTREIDIYDSLYKTGCDALDIILAEKALYCQQYSIAINCIADGAKLSFISESDIYSLFGNILENAINAVQDMPEDNRNIVLSIKSRGELITINARNGYAGEIKMRDGLPVTKNADTANHGIGTRSIQMIVQKYGGTVSFSARNGIFNVNILFTMDFTYKSKKE